MIDYAARGLRAKELLNDELLTEVFAKIEAASLEAVLTAATDQERCRHIDTVKTVRSVRQALKTEMDMAHVKAKDKVTVA